MKIIALIFLVCCGNALAQVPEILQVDYNSVVHDFTESPMCSKKGMIVLQSNPIAEPTNYVRQSFDVLNYSVSMDLRKLPSKVIDSAECTITFVWVETPDTFRFHLRGLTPKAVTYKTQLQSAFTPTTFAVSGVPADAVYHYKVTATNDMKKGDTITMKIRYAGTMTPEVGSGNWGGVQVDGNGVYALGVGFANNYVSATQHWMPCYDHPGDKATFDATFLTRGPEYVASNGLLVEAKVLPDLSIRQTWKMKDACATYLMTFAADHYVPVEFKGMHVPAVVYSRAVDTAATRKSFSLLPRVLSLFERYFGNYPFEKIGYANTQKGSMEHQTMICVAKSVSQSRDTLNQNGYHELAHQWFGDLVTPFDFRDAWLTESFATFCETLWHQELFGNTGYLNEMQRKINRYLTVLGRPGGNGFEGILPLYNFPRKSPSSNYPETIYQKGAAVLGMLRYHVGDTDFFATLKEYLHKYAYANASIDSMQTVFEQTVSPDKKSTIKPFFDSWVRGVGWAVLNIECLKIRKENNYFTAVLNITQTQTDSFGVQGLFPVLPLEITFSDANGNKVHKVITLTSKTQEVTLDSLNNFNDVSINKGNTVRSLVLLAKNPVITSVEDNISTTYLAAHPNPASSVVWYSIPTEGEFVLSVKNIMGQEVYHSIVRSESTFLRTLDISALQNGVYQCTLSGDASFYSFPIIVAK